jgi:outer membrane protein assembly factor BamB
VGGTLYLVADSGTAFALDPATGAERWRFQLGTTGRSPSVDPAGGSGVLVVDGALYASPLAATLYAIGD